jgi:ATP-dependent RNA helicase RhlE
MSFLTLGLDDRILRAIKDAGYTEPTPIQSAAVPVVLAGHDVIGIAQTGTGKTAAFTLPLLTLLSAQPPAAGRRRTRTLVLAPTRELVVQIEENVRAYARHLPALHIAKVFGGVGERPQMDALRAGVDIVIATPGRLLDLMDRGCADFGGMQFLVLDEADRMLDMGFVPAIRRVVKALPRQRQTLLFSATLSKEIEVLTKEFQQHPKKVEIGRRSNPAETVTQFVYEVRKDDKPALLAHLLRDPAMDTVLVFTRTKHGADKVAKRLARDGVTTAALHANRSQSQRLRALQDFKSGKVRVLVATDIASRGIDVDGISHVVNFDFPPHVEDYVHRIGRTGRANAIGDAISFVTSEDYGALRGLEKFIGRGIVRKTAEGFVRDTAPDSNERARPRPPQRQQQQQRRPQHGPRGASPPPRQHAQQESRPPQHAARPANTMRETADAESGTWRRPSMGRRSRRR